MTTPTIHLRQETPADAPFVNGLFAAMKAEEFAPLGLPPEALAPLVEMQVAVYRSGLRTEFPFAECRVVEKDGRPAGFVALAREDAGLVLAQFLVEATERGAGIGTGVLASLLAEARALDLPLRLSVLPHNPARRLYQRMGFVETGQAGASLSMIAAARPSTRKAR